MGNPDQSAGVSGDVAGRPLQEVIHLKLGMKMPGGTVLEVERMVKVEEINQALDGHGVIRLAVKQMVEDFMETLNREKDAR